MDLLSLNLSPISRFYEPHSLVRALHYCGFHQGFHVTELTRKYIDLNEKGFVSSHKSKFFSLRVPSRSSESSLFNKEKDFIFQLILQVYLDALFTSLFSIISLFI